MTSVPEPFTRLLMIRDNLQAIPEFALPEGFELRRYRSGDESAWLDIHLKADLHNRITPELFERQFGADKVLLEQRQFYLIDPGGRVIGTATAWFNDDLEGTRIGRVHWVALLPEYQGRGLSKPLMTAVCHRLRELGHERAYLVTAAMLRPAIQLYLRFGFRPLIQNEADQVAWNKVTAQGFKA
jgi:GNAT superfamily N-acetyltransferase